MIDAATGDLIIESLPIHLGPRLTRSQFLASSLGSASRVLVENEPFCTYALPRIEMNDLIWGIGLQFYGEKLEAITMRCMLTELDNPWGEWEEMERQRKARHDRWLDAMLGTQRMFPWGEAGSSSDPKTGDSGIILRYSLGGQPWKGSVSGRNASR